MQSKACIHGFHLQDRKIYRKSKEIAVYVRFMTILRKDTKIIKNTQKQQNRALAFYMWYIHLHVIVQTTCRCMWLCVVTCN